MKDDIFQILTKIILKLVSAFLVLGIFCLFASEYITYTFHFAQIIDIAVAFIMFGGILMTLYVIIYLLIVKK